MMMIHVMTRTYCSCIRVPEILVQDGMMFVATKPTKHQAIMAMGLPRKEWTTFTTHSIQATRSEVLAAAGNAGMLDALPDT
jgi:hypothetical protein